MILPIIKQAWLLRRKVPNGYWMRRCHRVAYMEWLGHKLDFHAPEEWYALKRRHFLHNRGGGLLAGVYRDSPLEALRDFMPDRDWHPWLLNCTPQRFWTDRVNRRAYMTTSPFC